MGLSRSHGRSEKDVRFRYILIFSNQHPEVYIIFIPATGLVSAIIATFAGRRSSAIAVVLALVATAFSASGYGCITCSRPAAGDRPELFHRREHDHRDPSGVQMFCWIVTILTGRPVIRTPLLWVVGFFLPLRPRRLDRNHARVGPDRPAGARHVLRRAHFHYVLIGGAVFPLFGAIYHWFPKMTGRMMNELRQMELLAVLHRL